MKYDSLPSFQLYTSEAKESIQKIQAETASEPLTLEEEYAMQRSWRTDVDKLTFIACLPLPILWPSLDESPRTLKPGTADSPSRMIGDVNLFLTSSVSPPSSPTHSSTSPTAVRFIIGELELMIAPSKFRRQGHGRGAVIAFLSYISTHLRSILQEYGRGQEPPIEDVRLEGLRVKIGQANEGSLGLFKSLRFASREGGEGLNYFGEVELWFDGELGDDSGEKMRNTREQWGMVEYVELAYGQEDSISESVKEY
ncbi:related to METHIONYL-TRNA SYNTHETASE, mitochondrial [Rhynchosporium graminicola]|uniref:Related to METHIONYL-TRNA SYNTHETASE, mitochondrial n=1 Tax=Rhynchosporium graminicola TaxID=2792576 RepID=A0A1E1KWE7_9HELO|nr:related to METHIONYL-TRNA SYNTHETASE, mitochondrial [Rhynchosporium commune]